MKSNKLTISISTLIILIAITSHALAQQNASKEAIVRQYIIEFWNRNNIEAVNTVLASEAILISPDGMFKGVEAIRSLRNSYLEAFSDLSLVIKNLSTNSDQVQVKWILKGTHDGEILGIAPTWQAIELQGTSVYALEGNKIVKEVKEYSQQDFLEQLGVVLELEKTANTTASNFRAKDSTRYGKVRSTR